MHMGSVVMYHVNIPVERDEPKMALTAASFSRTGGKVTLRRTEQCTQEIRL